MVKTKIKKTNMTSNNVIKSNVKRNIVNINTSNVNLTEPVLVMPNQIGTFSKLSERRWGMYYNSMKTNEGIDIHYNSDMKEYRVKNIVGGMPKKMIYVGKNQFDALNKAKNYMGDNQNGKD